MFPSCEPHYSCCRMLKPNFESCPAIFLTKIIYKHTLPMKEFRFAPLLKLQNPSQFLRNWIVNVVALQQNRQCQYARWKAMYWMVNIKHWLPWRSCVAIPELLQENQHNYPSYLKGWFVVGIIIHLEDYWMWLVVELALDCQQLPLMQHLLIM